MAAASPQIRLWGYPSTLGLVGFDALLELILDNLDWGRVTRIRFAEQHLDAVPIGAVSYNHTTAKHRLPIGGTGGED